MHQPRRLPAEVAIAPRILRVVRFVDHVLPPNEAHQGEVCGRVATPIFSEIQFPRLGQGRRLIRKEDIGDAVQIGDKIDLNHILTLEGEFCRDLHILVRGLHNPTVQPERLTILQHSLKIQPTILNEQARAAS